MVLIYEVKIHKVGGEEERRGGEKEVGRGGEEERRTRGGGGEGKTFRSKILSKSLLNPY